MFNFTFAVTSSQFTISRLLVPITNSAIYNQSPDTFTLGFIWSRTDLVGNGLFFMFCGILKDYDATTKVFIANIYVTANMDNQLV